MEKFISFGQENEKLYMCITNMLSGEFDDYNTVTTLLEKYVDRIIFAIVRNEQITEMLTGQAITDIFNSLGELDNAKHFWKWCYQKIIDIAVSYILENGMDMQLDSFKKNVPEGITFDYWHKDKELFIPGIIVMDDTNLLQLWARLGSLTMGQQVAMLYFYFAEMSVDEIAVALNTTPKNIRRGIDYARNIVKDMITEYYGKVNLKKLSMNRLPVIQIAYREVVHNVANKNDVQNNVIYNIDSGNKASVEFPGRAANQRKSDNSLLANSANFLHSMAQTLFQPRPNYNQQFAQPMNNQMGYAKTTSMNSRTNYTASPLMNNQGGYTEAPLVNNQVGYTEAPLVNNQGGYTEAPLVNNQVSYTEAPLVNNQSFFTDGIELISHEAPQRVEVINISDSNTLENIIESGSGVQAEYLRETDPEKFYTMNYKWFDLAAKAGNTDAMNNLAYCFFFGYGTKKNYGLAISWYKKSAKAGNEYAIAYLKQLEEQGYIGQEDN